MKLLATPHSIISQADCHDKRRGDTIRRISCTDLRQFQFITTATSILLTQTAEQTERKRSISLPVATAIVVANMVGVGVFTSLGYQVAGIPSGFPIIVLWTLGGIISLCGAVCYAELGAMMPRSGGEYHFLREAYHPLAGFLAGWVSITVGFAAPIAANSLALGDYAGAITGRIPLSFSIPVVLLVTAIHFGKIEFTGVFQVVITSLKIVLVLVLIVSAFAVGTAQPVSFLPAAGDGALIRSGAFATSLVYVMYAYAGWNAAAYVAGEVTNPSRNLPLAMIVGTLLVTILYVALNAAFLYSTPMHLMEGQTEVGLIAAKSIFGDRIGTVIGLLISLGLISTISSMTWAGPRVFAMIGEDYRLFSMLAKRNRFGVPAWALLVQASFVLILSCTTDFKELVKYVESLLILSGLLAVIAVVWLRFRRPNAKRPYRVPLVWIPATIFTAMSSYMLYFLALRDGALMLWAFATLAIGLVVYFIANANSAGKQSE